MQTFTHGSEDSLDHDTYVIFDDIPTFHEAKAFCDSQKEDNANILVIQDGKVIWCFKGIEDECNNSLLTTYDLHEQKFPQPISSLVERDVPIKMVRTIRGLLSYFSRTELRIDVKKALRSNDVLEKLEVLEQCHLSLDIDFKKTTHIEVFKFFAFQMGQTLALMDGVELFTKSSVAERYPELSPYLYREDVSTDAIEKFFTEFKIVFREKLLTIENVENLFIQDKISKFS